MISLVVLWVHEWLNSILNNVRDTEEYNPITYKMIPRISWNILSNYVEKCIGTCPFGKYCPFQMPIGDKISFCNFIQQLVTSFWPMLFLHEARDVFVLGDVWLDQQLPWFADIPVQISSDVGHYSREVSTAVEGHDANSLATNLANVSMRST